LLATKLKSRELEFFDVYDDNVGEIFNPVWRAQGSLRLSYMDYRLNWTTRFIGGGEPDVYTDYDEFPACAGLDVLCRPVAYTEDYQIHTVSVSYGQDNWAVTAGMRNVFDEAPPLIDASNGGEIRNVPLGAGYDLFGRTVFASVNYTF
jgi:iron complex outermembrane receptor protein